MKVRLLRDARIRHNAGETVCVSPAEAGFLISTGSAVAAEDVPTVITRTEKETPEDGRPETEERAVKTETEKAGAKAPAKKPATKKAGK